MEPVRFHHLRTIGAKSPAHLRALLDGDEREQTRPMEKGTATHALLLGGRRVIAYPGAVRRGQEWAAFEAANADAEIITKSDYEAAARMAESVSNNADAMRALSGVREKSIQWSFLGRTCRSTPDSYALELVGELKTCRDSDPARFARYALRMGYHAQCAWYRQAVLESGKGQPREVFIVAVESSAPYPVTVLRLTDRALDMGQRLVRLWFERLLSCEQSGQWPGYVQSIVDFDIPDDDFELTFGVGMVEAA